MRLAVPVRLSEDWAIIEGVRTKLQVARFKLSYSRAFFVRAHLLQTHEMLLEAGLCKPPAGWGGRVEKNVQERMNEGLFSSIARQ